MTYAVAGVLARNGDRDVDVGPGGASSITVDHAVVGATAVTVDLVDGHVDGATGTDLGKLVTSGGHDGLGASLQVVGASTDGLAEGVGGLALEAGGIGLEGIATGSVTRSAEINTEGHASATELAGSADDGTVASHQVGGGKDSSSSDGLERHFD